MSGETPELDLDTAARGLGEFARSVADGYNNENGATPPPSSEQTDGDGDTPPPPASNTAPTQGQGQNWFLDLLAQKFGFSSGQDFMSGIMDMIFGNLDLSGIPIIGDLFSRGNNTSVAENENEGPTDTTTVVADNNTPTGALDDASAMVRTDYDAAAGPGATDVASVDPSLIPGGPANGQS